MLGSNFQSMTPFVKCHNSIEHVTVLVFLLSSITIFFHLQGMTHNKCVPIIDLCCVSGCTDVKGQ